jgi:hypothetical protein
MLHRPVFRIVRYNEGGGNILVTHLTEIKMRANWASPYQVIEVHAADVKI